MKRKNKLYFLFKFLLIILFALTAYYITKQVRPEFPKIEPISKDIIFHLCGERSISLSKFRDDNFPSISTPFCKSKWHNLCSKNYNYSSLNEWVYHFDESTVKEGDTVQIYVQLGSSMQLLNKIEFQSGINKDSLRKIDKIGLTDTDVVYTSKNNITIYGLSCFNREFFEMSNQSNFVVRVQFKRPSFIDSSVGTFFVFIGAFVLLLQAFELIEKALMSK